MKKTIFCIILMISAWSNILASNISFFAVDPMINIYPDVDVQLSNIKTVDVPRNSTAVFAFILKSDENKRFALSKLLMSAPDGRSVVPVYKIYEVIPVHLEANSQGGSKTIIGGTPPESWMPYLIRKAPFDVFEVLNETKAFNVAAVKNTMVLCEISVPSDYQEGVYGGVLVLESKDESVFGNFSFTVHQTQLKDSDGITPEISHWLSILPEDLTSTDVPQAWSQRYWQLLERAAQELAAYGDTVATPELFSEDISLIDITIEKDGSYSFDFTKLDRFFEIFINAGFKRFDAACIVGGHWIFPYNVYAFDKRKSENVKILAEDLDLRKLNKQYESEGKAPQSWEQFAQTPQYQASLVQMEQFLRLLLPPLYEHLSHKGRLDMYRQQLLDEPRRVEDYKWASQLCRELMPGVKIVNAIHGYLVDEPAEFTPYVDVWIMEHKLLTKQISKDIIAQRSRLGLKTGMYNLGEPPMPNRRLDRPLLNNRLEGWLIYNYGCNYYIHWAANRYRGLENEYQKSIGPIPKVKWPQGYEVGTPQNPGHSPGTNWFYYRSENGLRAGLRMVIFREGLTDLKLLNMLKKYDSEKADEMAKRIVRSSDDYQSSAEVYNSVRKDILEILDNIEGSK